MTKGYVNAYGRALVPTAATTKKPNAGCVKVAPTVRKGPAVLCKDVKEMLQPKGRIYPALLVQRGLKQFDIQQHVDKLAKSGAFGMEQSAQEKVELPWETERLAFDLSKKAKRLVAFAVQHGLPKEFGPQIQQDFEEIGMTLAKLVPTARRLLLKLDIMGASVCAKWHRDNYIGRAVITYNGNGTEFVDHNNVNWDVMENRGADEQRIRDKSKILSSNVGDILFMKGLLFPGTPNGLVHRSPEICWHADGSVVNRLLLKVDLE
jgi:hypothetical protein